MNEELQSRNVFLDTHVFVAETFFVGTTKLTALQKLAAEGKVRLLMSTITVAECTSRIKKMVDEAEQALIKNERKLAILRNAASLDTSFLAKLDKPTVIKEIEDKFERFLKDAKITICPGVPIELLFSEYFVGNPPFGEDQKKDQFPDAAAMLSLAAWCDAESQRAYVISGDPDIESVCKANPKFIFKSGVAEFLDIHNKHETLSANVTQILAAKAELIKNQVQTKFEAAGFSLEGEIGDVENVEVSGVDIEDSYVISVHDEYAIAEVHATVSYSADISYRDYSRGYGDSSTWEFSHASVQKSTSLTAEVEIEFDKSAPEKAELSVSIGPRDIEVPFSSEDADHWK